MEWFRITPEGDMEFINEEVKLVPELNSILTLAYNKGPKDADGRKKYRAKKEIKWMVLSYSPKSPYADYSAAERNQEAKADCKFSDDWEPSTELKLLIPKYLKATPNKLDRLLVTAEGVLDKLDEHLSHIDLGERKENGDMLNKPKDVIDTLKQLPSLAQTILTLQQQVRLGTITNSRTRGDQEEGWMGGDDDYMQTKETTEEDGE